LENSERNKRFLLTKRGGKGKEEENLLRELRLMPPGF